MAPSPVPVVITAALIRRQPEVAAASIQQALAAADGSLDPAAAALGVSRSSVQRWVRRLREQGYEFRVRARGEKLDTGAAKPEELLRRLAKKPASKPRPREPRTKKRRSRKAA